MTDQADVSDSSLVQGNFTPSKRIAELNEIDQSITVLLSSAAEAVEILSNTSSDSDRRYRTNLSTEQDKFKNAASSYFSTLSAIEVRLRRQVYALEEAGLIPEGDERDVRRGRAIGGDNTARTSGGPLDTSWLNARADNKVELGMKRELYAEALDFVTTMKSLEKQNSTTASTKVEENTA